MSIYEACLICGKKVYLHESAKHVCSQKTLHRRDVVMLRGRDAPTRHNPTYYMRLRAGFRMLDGFSMESPWEPKA